MVSVVNIYQNVARCYTCIKILFDFFFEKVAIMEHSVVKMLSK